MQAADLAARLAIVIKSCGEDGLLSKLGVVLFEHLGEEYPDTLGRSVWVDFESETSLMTVKTYF
jgi:hypothetical protein